MAPPSCFRAAVRQGVRSQPQGTTITAMCRQCWGVTTRPSLVIGALSRASRIMRSRTTVSVSPRACSSSADGLRSCRHKAELRSCRFDRCRLRRRSVGRASRISSCVERRRSFRLLGNQMCEQKDFVTRANLRYARSLAYLRKLSEDYGFELEMTKSKVTRLEHGNDVVGSHTASIVMTRTRVAAGISMETMMGFAAARIMEHEIRPISPARVLAFPRSRFAYRGPIAFRECHIS
jgi:hypothetical protein